MNANQSAKLQDDKVNGWISDFLNTGDKRFLGKIYEEHKQALFFHCLRILYNQEDAKDLTAEAFIRAFENIHKFDLNRPFFPWLARIATNLCIDFLRRKSAIQFNSIEETKTRSGEESALAQIEKKELREKIGRAILKLKGSQRHCFYLFYIHEKSYKEIVQITGYSYNRVRSCIQNSRRNFKLAMAIKN